MLSVIYPDFSVFIVMLGVVMTIAVILNVVVPS
jgi:hypothetical protein